jgi:uncharacterized protein YgiM (DUF1202 family)
MFGNTRTRLTTGAHALTILAFSVESAFAAIGVANSSVNMREGPGTNHGVLAVVPAGATVDVTACESWCQITYGDLQGWVSARYIDIVDEGAAMSDPEAPQTVSQVSGDGGPSPLTTEELEVLVAPIALYPDELVALVIAASLYPVDIVQGARFLEERKTNASLEPSDDWDGSVISLLNYPDIVKMMSDDLDWTQMLGEAAINQQKELLVAIQQLRDQAVATDLLKTTEQVVVTTENENVVIQSADPEVIYVPQYEPQILYDPTYVSTSPQPLYYSDPYPNYWYPNAGFWTGAITGAAFAAVVDWDDWGTWGGDVDIDVKKDGDKVKIDFGDRSTTIDRDDINFDRDNLNIDRDKMNINRDNLKNIDRSNIEVGNIDRSQISRDLRQNNNNRVTNRKPPQNAVAQRPTAGNDVRRNVQSGLSQRPTAAQRPTTTQRPTSRAAPPRPSTQPANRTATKRPPSRPAASNAPNRSTKSVSSRKPGTSTASRPSKPSAMGNPSRGKPTSIHSSRGRSSHGGGISGGRSRGGGGFGGGGGGGRRR